MHDREQPGPKIGAGLPELFLNKRAAQRVLHQIIRPFAVARERPRIASQPGNLLFDESVKFGQFALSSRGALRRLMGESLQGYCNSMMHAARYYVNNCEQRVRINIDPRSVSFLPVVAFLKTTDS